MSEYVALGSPNDSIEGKLNPKYWDRHYCGDGDAAPFPEVHENPQAKKFAAQALEAHIRRGASKVALPPDMRTGYEFNAANFDPGSVFLAVHEELFPASAAADMRRFYDDQLDHPPGYGDRISAVGHGYRYFSSPTWLVVAPTKKGNALVEYNDDTPAGPLGLGLAHFNVPTFTVGAVNHFANPRNPKVEHLTRIRTINSCSAGIPQTEKSRAWLPFLRLRATES